METTFSSYLLESLAPWERGDRVVLLYAVSGAGKTSLLKAGLLPGLESRGFAPLPVAQVRDEPPPGFSGNRYALSVIQRLEAARPAAERLPREDLGFRSLEEYLAARYPAGLAGRVLVFDQFEDVLRIDPTDTLAKEAFFRDVGRVLRADGVRAVLSLREEFVAGLDPYLQHLPTRLASRFRLGLLGPDAAREAVSGPAKDAGRPFHPQAAEELVRQLRLTRVQRPDGRGVEEREGPTVEPVQLQVVCQLVWDRVPATATEIGPAVLAGFSVDRALEQYYAAKVAAAARAAGVEEARVRRWVEEALITEQRLRGQVLKGPGETKGLPNAAVDGLVGAYLVRAEQRLGGTWYELTHDRLVDPVRQSNRAWLAPRLRPFQLQADQWAVRTGDAKDALLLKGVALADAESWAAAHPGDLRELDTEYLEKSRAVRTVGDRVQTAFFKWWAYLSTAALIGLFVLAAVALWQSSRASDEANRANKEADRANEEVEKVLVANVEAKKQKEAAEAAEEQAKRSELAARDAAKRAETSLDALVDQYTRMLAPITERAGRLATATTPDEVKALAEKWRSLDPPSPFVGADWLPDSAQLRRNLQFNYYQDQLDKYSAQSAASSAVNREQQEALTLNLARKYGRAILPADETLRAEVLHKLREKAYPKAAAVTAAVAAAASPDTPRAKADIKRFWELYWGELAIVEDGDKGVESAMVEFGRVVKARPWDQLRLKSAAAEVKTACDRTIMARR